MHRRTILIAFAALLPGFSNAYDAASLVDAARGTLPLILTVPHDGGESLGLLPVRTKGALVRDAGTRDLAERVASQLESRTGKRPYIVIAKFSRKYLDANRSEQDAMESLDALPAYRAYHGQISSFISDIKATFPGGAILIDVHGQSDEPYTTFRGTRAGLTAKSLLSRFGPSALQGEKSLIGVLASKGYRVNPEVGSQDLREDARFVGGYTVFTYGSQHPDGIDAIQLEFGRDHRNNIRLPEDVTESLMVFMKQYQLLTR